MKKKICMACLALLLCILALDSGAVYAKEAGSSTAQEPASVIQDVRKSVVVVSIWAELDTGDDMQIGWGSGFFLASEEENMQYLVTNNHVISHFMDNGRGEAVENIRIQTGKKGQEKVYNLGPGRMKIRTYFDSEKSDKYVEAYVVARNKIKDLAVLKLDMPTTERAGLTLCRPDDSMVGSRIYVVGYPGLSENSFAGAVSRWEISDSSVVDGSLSRLLTAEGTGVRRIQTNAAMQAGNSGGPLVNEKGQVIGINYMAVYTGDVTESNNYAINVEELIPILDKNNVKYLLAGRDEDIDSVEDENTGDSGLNGNGETGQENGTGINGGSGQENGTDSNGGAGTENNSVSGGNVGSDHNAGTGSDVTKGTDDPGKDTLYMRLVIAAAAAAVIVLCGVLLWNRKKSSSVQAGGMPIQQAGPGGTGNPSVCSLCAQHNGARFFLNGTTILIGRDVAACGVVFREGTPGVSNRHCSVSYDTAAGEFILTDLKSTYGTFLANGQQLTPGMPYRLKPGEEFYLGGSVNMLRVDV